MSAESIYINFDDEFHNVNNALNEVRTKFQDETSYNEDVERSKNIVIAQLELLRDPDHAAQVRQGATTAIADIKKFASTNAELTNQVAMLLLTLEQNTLAYAMQMIPTPVFERPANSIPSAAETIHNYIKNLNAKQRENVALAASAILLGHQVAGAVRAAVQSIAMRQATLEQAARELTPANIGAPGGVGNVVEAGGKAVAEEFKMTVLGEILKQAVLELGTHIPIAGIVVSIARVASDIRARQAALEERYELQQRIRDAPYQRGPIDRMFDLSAQLQDEDQITAGVIALISQLVVALQERDA